MLITLYGINNIGKTTQAKRLVEMLREAGHDTEYVKYPVYDIEPTGPYINNYLRGDSEMTEYELQMWFALNRHQFEAQLKAWLDGGKIVVAEDYKGTGIAWGTVKGIETEWIEELNSKLIPEDFVIMLDGKRFIEAKEAGHAHEDNPEFMRLSSEVHKNLAKKYGWSIVQVIPGDIETTAQAIWEVLALHLPAKSA